jgi:hypothetical protein
MNEKSPEAWLGNFLTVIGTPPALSYTSIEQARLDRNLREHLARLVGEAAREEPERMLQPGFADELRERDWSAWWRAQDALARYAYAALSLAMLGDESRLPDVVALYGQESNARIRKDAHYVMCYLLGKDWPAYAVTEADVRRVESGQVSPSSGA